MLSLVVEDGKMVSNEGVNQLRWIKLYLCPPLWFSGLPHIPAVMLQYQLTRRTIMPRVRDTLAASASMDMHESGTPDVILVLDR